MQDMVAYTDEQKKVIETLQKAFKDAKECGLQCLVGDDHLRLINVKVFPKYHIIDSEWEWGEDDALDVYFTEDVAMVEGVYRNYGDSPVLVVELKNQTIKKIGSTKVLPIFLMFSYIMKKIIYWYIE